MRFLVFAACVVALLAGSLLWLILQSGKSEQEEDQIVRELQNLSGQQLLDRFDLEREAYLSGQTTDQKIYLLVGVALAEGWDRKRNLRDLVINPLEVKIRLDRLEQDLGSDQLSPEARKALSDWKTKFPEPTYIP